ncbi:MAG: histidine--tRNA ligase [Planctomycetes bacterium]|nr:histidine--tRNA ligase [Planctomycetota bacterium]
MSAKIQSVKGTRDFYPDVLAPIRQIFDAWRRVSIRHGFQEWDGPTLELLDLYREKSGDELVGQLYRLTDSGGRELALRPEMTPTLARMVAAKINALPKPIKWFCVATLFRGENVQRGRLREFFQWNVDVIGSADMTADAEVILVGVEALRELGLTQADFQVHISNRRLVQAILSAAGIPVESHGGAYALMDKAGKLPREETARRWSEAYGSAISYEKLDALMSVATLPELRAAVGAIAPATADLESAASDTERLLAILQDFGIIEYCKINLRVVRGLAYYTGPVFEFYDRSENERAICGGGRYDDLLGKLGRAGEPAVGFGMGDVVLSLILEEKGLLKPARKGGDVMVVDAAESVRPTLHTVVAALRRGGVAADFSYAHQAIGKQLKMADKIGVSRVVILGDETTSAGRVRIKDMAGGAEREVALETLLADPRSTLGL